MRGDAALQVEAVHAQEQHVHVQRAQRFLGQAAVEGHVLAPQLAAEHDDVDVALRRQCGKHAEVVADHGHLDVGQRFGKLDGGGSRVDGDGVAGLDHGRGTLADAALFLQEGRSLGFVGRFRQRPADHAAVDGAAVGARHDPAFGQVTQVLAHGLHAHAETPGQGGHLHAAMLAHEFADLQASLTGVAGGDHGYSLRLDKSIGHFVKFRY